MSRVYRPRVTEEAQRKHREDERRRRRANPEHIRAVDRARQPQRNAARARNPEPHRARWRSYRARHPEEFKRRDRAQNLRRKYGLTIADYDRMMRKQKGRCKICRRKCKTGRRLAVDHPKGKREVRALLCAACNRGIGCLQHDPRLLRRAARYIEGKGKLR